MEIKTSEIKKIEDELSKYIDSNVEFILKIGNYILSSGGKRLRPILVLTFSKGLKGENSPNDYPIAIAMEYLHTASLLHDDVVDGAKLRRKKPSANVVFGNDTVVLTGDYMYANALYLFSIYGNIDMIKNVSNTVKKMAEGQLLELKSIGDLNITMQDYYQIIEGKTAVLFASCCYVGAELANADNKIKQNAYNYGLYLGYAFQIIDDLLDYIGNKNKVGKPVFNDLREGKVTYPLLSIKDKLSQDEKEFVKKTIRTQNPDEKHIEKVVNMVIDKGGVENSLGKAKEYVNKAIRELDIFPQNEYFSNLRKLAKYIVEREF
ncbi:MAG: polyprenyl synthetase family protein [Aquificae bacterium]|nr:polyprenyl synthetase family protein [Aquificota bacterium]